MKTKQLIVIDLNGPTFQQQLFALEDDQLVEVIAMMRKLQKMDWATLHTHKGFHWEDAGRMQAPNGANIKSIRITQKARALAYRDGPYMRFLSLHFDHDSAYR